MVTSRNLLAEGMGNKVVKKGLHSKSTTKDTAHVTDALLCCCVMRLYSCWHYSYPRYLFIGLEVVFFSEGRGSLPKHGCCSVLNFCADLVHYLVFQQTERKFISFSSVAIR